MTNPSIQAGDPGDLLAIITNTFGYAPSDSLVMLGLQGSQTGGFLRMDLSGAAKNPVYVASEFCPIFADDHEACVVALMTDHAPAGEEEDRDVDLLGRVIVDAMAKLGVAVVTVWKFGGGYARHLDCTEATCCSGPGIPAVVLSEAAESLMPEKEVTPEERVQTFEQGTPAAEVSAEAAETSTEEGLQMWDALISGEVSANALSPRGMAGLTTLLTGTGPQALIATAVAGLATGYAELMESESPAPAVADSTGPAPDWQRIDGLAEALREVFPYAAKEGKAGAYAVMSWISWAKGAGTLHTLYTDRALKLDPSHELAQVLTEQTQRFGLSKWQQDRRTAYTPGR